MRQSPGHIVDMLLEPLSTLIVHQTVTTTETSDHVKTVLDLVTRMEVVRDEMMMQAMKPNDGAVFTATFVHASSDAHGHTECTFGDGMSAMTMMQLTK